MELQYKGANCIILTQKKSQVVIDDNLSQVGLGGVSSKADVQIFTNKEFEDKLNPEAFLVDGPGEYEIAGIAIAGIPARAHMDTEGQHTTTMYRLTAEGVNIVVTGHIYPELNDDQLEKLGRVDVLILPVGGNGYTLDAVGAAKMVKKIEPRVVVPTHYEDSKVKYEVPQNPVEDFLKEIGVEAQLEDKLKLKGITFPENLTVYKLSIS